MSRSSWKVPFINKSLYWQNIKTYYVSKNKIKNNVKNKKKLKKRIQKGFFKPIICSRSSIVNKSLLGLKAKVHNGKRYITFIVRQKMLGHKFGEFCVTKIMGSAIAARKRAKEKKNKLIKSKLKK